MMTAKTACVARYTKLITFALAGTLALAGLAGCGSSTSSEDSYDPPAASEGTASATEAEDSQSTTGTEGASSWNTDDQTAPMPETEITEDQILGKWSPNPDDVQPTYIDFFYREGKLYYFYYIEVLGDGSGIGIANGTSEMEINQGIVMFMGNQGRCSCLSFNGGGRTAIDFYVSDIADGVIYDQEDGTTFYYVGPSTEGDHYLYDFSEANFS